ncbi:MAG TPA: hypothetical protein VF354_00595, partial [Candidatus Methanoperedens sp.]
MIGTSHRSEMNFSKRSLQINGKDQKNYPENRSMNICFYISDYGYGHASRSIAIIRKLLSEYKYAKIYIKNSGAFDYLRRSLPNKNVEVVRSKNDIGVIFKENSVIVDREQ